MATHSDGKVWLMLLLAVVAASSQDEDDEWCPKKLCTGPNCFCMTTQPIFPNRLQNNPQFVMLTFDDAVTISNIGTYRELLTNRQNKGNKCPIAATFFVSHEYTDYTLVHELWKNGSEIAVHSISHHPETAYWRFSKAPLWYNETVGMKQILNQYGKIPYDDIIGFRAPFLQTAGDTTFKVLHDNFKWDSSMPTLSYADNSPVFPYTLDYEYLHDCQIKPCPQDEYKGLWVVPLVMWFRDKGLIRTHCSMLDACTPYPVTSDDTFNYFKSNFERHYLENRAPFPVFVHEAWLKNAERKKGYLQFVDWILQKDDVFVVTVNEVLQYLGNPVPLKDYTQRNCRTARKPDLCDGYKVCTYTIVSEDGIEMSRIMKSCTKCPPQYPNVKDPLGKGR